MARQARVLLIVVDGPLADGLSGLLTASLGADLLGPCSNLGSALEVAADSHPDIILLDSGPVAKHFAAAIVSLRMASPESVCIILADDTRQQKAAEKAGAHVALLKGCRPSDLVAAVANGLAPRDAADRPVA